MGVDTQQPTVEPRGVSLVAGRPSRMGDAEFTALDPTSASPGSVRFAEATPAEVARAARLAAAAWHEAGDVPGQQLVALLNAAATELERVEDPLIDLLGHETGLAEARLRREFARTTGQLRFFADVVTEGAHLEAVIDRPDPHHPALPRPDLRRVLVPVGPVAVFGASNFPLAYSVPGGDTASALAAGCPVVVKAHPAHPGASEICGAALARAVRVAGLPDGWTSILQGSGTEVGRAIVLAPEIRAVGFTGSLAGGRALHDLAASRPEPIPVYAEMGSINPIVVTRGAATARAPEIATGFVSSVTTDGGQFCTKPGLMFVPEGQETDELIHAIAGEIGRLEPAVLVSERIRDALSAQVERTAAIAGVEPVARGAESVNRGVCHAPVVFVTSVETFLDNPALGDEHFGPCSLIVRYRDDDKLLAALDGLDGSLTATIHVEPAELELIAPIHRSLAGLAGRLVWNGFPTGLAVSYATHHGGPYPATSDALHTSVGATAIRRFLRPVCYQGAPQQVLPPALRDDNPLGIMRRVDGRWTDQPIKAPAAAEPGSRVRASGSEPAGGDPSVRASGSEPAGGDPVKAQD